MPNSVTSMSNKRPLTAEEKAMADRMKAIIESTPGLTQESVGASVGVSQGQVWQWLEGRLPVSAKRAPALAEALGIQDPAEISVAYREISGTSFSRPKVVDLLASHPQRFDVKILVATHRALRELHESQFDSPYNLEDDPVHFLQAYELRAKLSQVSPADLVEIFRASGLGTDEGATGDGRSRDGTAGVPNESTHKGGMAGKVQRKKGGT